MENIIWGVLLTLGAGLLVWLGVRYRKKARQQYEADSRRGIFVGCGMQFA